MDRKSLIVIGTAAATVVLLSASVSWYVTRPIATYRGYSGPTKGPIGIHRYVVSAGLNRAKSTYLCAGPPQTKPEYREAFLIAEGDVFIDFSVQFRASGDMDITILPENEGRVLRKLAQVIAPPDSRPVTIYYSDTPKRSG